MRAFGPAKIGVHVLFIVALARIAQSLGVRLTQSYGEAFTVGDIGHAAFDVNRIAKIPDAIESGIANVYQLLAIAKKPPGQG